MTASLRVTILACQAATLVITWPLWQARESPPLLPLLEGLPRVPFGIALLASLVAALRWPRAGAAAHALLLVAAIGCDQTREQPQVLSLCLMLCVSACSGPARAVGALHLIALWMWSGLGKLTSPRFLGAGGAWLLGGHAEPGSPPALVAALALGSVELAAALLALVPRTRATAGTLGCLLHASIAVYLSPLCRDANPAVWPWNVALAVAARALLRRPSGSAAPLRLDALAPRVACALCALLPLGYHAGFVDAGLAHQVYVLNEPRALWLRADGRTETLAELPTLRACLPQVPRIQAAFLRRAGRPGDRLVIRETRPLARALGASDCVVVRPVSEVPP